MYLCLDFNTHFHSEDRDRLELPSSIRTTFRESHQNRIAAYDRFPRKYSSFCVDGFIYCRTKAADAAEHRSAICCSENVI